MIPNPIADTVAEVVREAGAHLVACMQKREHGTQIIEVLTDTESGITINQCADISRALQAAFDARGLAGDSTLIVSSPGLDHPLQHLWQYRRHAGRIVEVAVGEGQSEATLRGEITAVSEDGVITLRDGDAERQIAFADIRLGTIIVSLKK